MNHDLDRDIQKLEKLLKQKKCQHKRLEHGYASNPPCSRCLDCGSYFTKKQLERLAMPDVIQDVLKERERQDRKWGEQNHLPPYWLGIITEEVGELAQAINETYLFNAREREKGGYKNMRTEAIQSAAVLIAFVECLDRNWKD
ncbi:NTP pyrophosphatase (non-canonical NTP hydrolase) [Evansella vedderi]|uniref:NTP pyrophosphatase (Non-canonical NTP hydrolase) n=1 Tax=Evansella vedderi TaxID=38282 RepID=A0ABT9ZUJ7_9BACI|nr:MazG-like family protein [Evansella vedderi]MDQ0254912.1 NTP pyrophosphatase (non-canonical NTP hydrolase) [Evansella vedderi]